MSKLATLALVFATVFCSVAASQEDGPDPNGRVAQERAERDAFVAYAEDYRKKRIKTLTEELRDNRISKSDYAAKKSELDEISSPSGVAWPPLTIDAKERDYGSLSTEHRYRVVDVRDKETMVLEATPKNASAAPASGRPPKGKSSPKPPGKLNLVIKFMPTAGIRAGEEIEPKGLFIVSRVPPKPEDSDSEWTLSKVNDENFKQHVLKYRAELKGKK